jgi:hypothetical protein
VAAWLVLGAVVRLVAPVADPRAVERDPYHLHLVIGGTPAQRAGALAHHRHHGHDSPRCIAELGRDGADATRPDDEVVGGSEGPRVVSLFPGATPGTMILGTAGLALATAAASTPTAPRMTGAVARPATLRLARAALPVPDPPPRADLLT